MLKTGEKRKKRQDTELSEAARMARNRYMRAWKRKNSDRVREYNKNFWERMAERYKNGDAE
jgi:hypothetical protein